MKNDNSLTASVAATNAANDATGLANISKTEGDHLAAVESHQDAAAKAENAARQLRASGEIDRARECEAAMAYHHRMVGVHKAEALQSVGNGRTQAVSTPHGEILAAVEKMRQNDSTRFPTQAAAMDAYLHSAAGKAAYEQYHDAVIVGDSRLPKTR